MRYVIFMTFFNLKMYGALDPDPTPAGTMVSNFESGPKMGKKKNFHLYVMIIFSTCKCTKKISGILFSNSGRFATPSLNPV